MNVTIRRATNTDLSALVTLENNSFNYDQIGLRSFAHLLKQRSSLLWCAEADQQIIGYAIILTRKNSRKWRIYSIAIAPEARGKGIGKALMLEVIESAKTASVSALSLEVKCDNKGAIELYRQLGFEVIDLLPEYYSDGTDGYRLQRTLEPQ
ncbi:N-acetyltransferase [Aliidiomarina shirensis]|uniref:N-acetyltransferase n=1 Tax=Aliidiomarina shirensis TaxID=1048642 RepID=A0A432WQW0_9GAMM|nr:N-acetyltransferase [Aliidiomarina shirensis]RUO36148.1 N-acetyltransferase [Aliidiomarina shirensis]